MYLSAPLHYNVQTTEEFATPDYHCKGDRSTSVILRTVLVLIFLRTLGTSSWNSWSSETVKSSVNIYLDCIDFLILERVVETRLK